jgi:hypothetical protein
MFSWRFEDHGSFKYTHYLVWYCVVLIFLMQNTYIFSKKKWVTKWQILVEIVKGPKNNNHG